MEKISKSLQEDNTADNIEIPEGKLSAWEKIGSLNTVAGSLDFYSGKSDNYHSDLSYSDESGRKVSIIESKINFNTQTGRHEFEYHHPHPELFEQLQSQDGFSEIFDNYLTSYLEKEKEILRTLDRESHVHRIYNHSLNINGDEQSIELIHQTRGGDCVLANLINTSSFESEDKNITMTLKDARELAILLRNRRGKDAREITSPDSALMSEDAFYLFYEKLGSRKPRNEDFMNIDGTLPEDELHVKALEVLQKITESGKNLCSVGMQIHSMSIKWLPEGEGKDYVVIDPMNREGLRFMNTDQIIDFIKNGIRGQSLNNNFFCFIN